MFSRLGYTLDVAPHGDVLITQQATLGLARLPARQAWKQLEVVQ